MTTLEERHDAPPVSSVEPDPGQPRHRRRRLAWLAAGVTLIAVGAGAWLWVGDRSTEAASAPTGPVATAVVERGTISATESWDGTLDYGAPVTIKSSGPGTVTRLVDQGQLVESGSELYRVDERPAIALLGEVPMYRNVGPGSAGVDVAQLEANLAELGYTGFTVDDSFDESTAGAVRLWQADVGAEPTGTVGRGDVVFIPGPGRVDALRVGVGELVAPGRPVLDLTGTGKVVSLEINVDDRDRFAIGTEVTVVLPAGDEVAGTVSSSAVVEPAAEPPGGPGGGNQTEPEAVTAVQITLAADVDDRWVGAPVDVIVSTDQRADVLLVPVNALLALSEGGYGLEVVGDEGSTAIVPVDTGLFAGGKVQVESDRIREGTVVGVAGR